MCYNWGMSEKEMRENEDTRPGNLKLGRKFSSEYQASPEAKSRGKRIKRAYKEEALATLEKILGKGALDDLIAGFADLKKVEQIAILEHLRDSSGQKPKDEPQTIIMPSINIKGI